MKKLSMDELNRMTASDFKEIEKIPLTVLLDNVRSMNNVGSVFRTCDAFRIKEIILCGITPCPPHREIQKTALGATETVCWSYFAKTEDAISLYQHQEIVTVGIEQTDVSVDLDSFEIDKNKNYLLIFGNEVNGISNSILNSLNTFIEIPQFGTKHSFNISVAAGIVLYRFCMPFLRNNQKD